MSAPAVDGVLARLLAYAEMGIPVLPVYHVNEEGNCTCSKGANCVKSPGKHPKTKHGVKDASTDPHVIQSWVRANVGGNWAIATGHQMKDGRYLCVLDVDPRSEGDITLAGILKEQGPLPVTPTQYTGGGGNHYLFATANPIASGVLGNGLDLQSVGKYALVEPSGHKSGGRYVWDEQRRLASVPIAEAPPWMLSGGAPKQRPELSGETARNSFLGVAFAEAGLLGVELADGLYAVRCPWAELHTDGRGRGRDSSTAILPPAAGSNHGGFRCQHAHCATRKWSDVTAVLPPAAVAKARARFPVKPRVATYDDIPMATVSDNPRAPALEKMTFKKNSPQPEKVMANIVAILRYDERWAGRILYDEFSQAILTRDPPWHEDHAPKTDTGVRAWTDSDDSRVQIWCNRFYDVDFSVSDVQRAVDVVARTNVVHPPKQYLTSLVWDGTPRIDRLFAHYFGADDTDYTKGVSRRWIISAVARIMEPGCKVDCVPVLEGAQGVGKSTALRTLASKDWFFDGDLDMGDKDARQVLRGKWIIELAELDSLGRSEVNKVKKFITNQIDEYRPSYGRRTVSFPRQCVFTGTTNETQYLKDTSGNRRFWPIECGQDIRVDELQKDRDQLWAEAVRAYEANATWYADTAEFRALCQEEQADRMQSDPWEKPIADWLAHQDPSVGILTTDVLQGPIGMDIAQIGKVEEMRAAAILKQLGWHRDRQERIQGLRVRRFKKRQW